MTGKRVSNIYGQVYGFAKEVLISLDQVYPGDHIAYERVKLYWHHVIVEDIDRELEEVKIIHYYNNVREFFETTSKEGSLAQVMRGSIKFWSKRYKIGLEIARKITASERTIGGLLHRLSRLKPI